MRSLSSLLVVLVLALLVAGCGQKGPLYRPAPEVVPAPDTQTTTRGESDDSGQR